MIHIAPEACVTRLVFVARKLILEWKVQDYSLEIVNLEPKNDFMYFIRISWKRDAWAFFATTFMPSCSYTSS
jgi:hypothetical protein